MVNTILLDKYICDSGYRTDFVASHIGMSVRSFNRKRTNKGSFTVSEADSLCRLLHISNPGVVFFGTI